jgi:cathepsin B
MTDRYCIASGGNEKPYLSAIHMVTCCGAHICGDCGGGLLAPAWNYWKDNGVVTGEGYGQGGW